MPRPSSTSRSSLALDNLRAVVILIVLAFHSVLAYVEWIPPRSSGFSDPPYGWRAFPIIDAHRWFGFDLFCAWQDVYLMSLMFFLSGLFVWPSLQRKHSFGYARDRLAQARHSLRIWRAGSDSHRLLSVISRHYCKSERVRLCAALFGAAVRAERPVWFLWQLLALNFVAAAIYLIAPNALRALGRWSGAAGQRPDLLFCCSRCCFGRGLCSPGAYLHAVGVVEFRHPVGAVVPTAALRRLFLCRHGHRYRRHRCWPDRRGRRARDAAGNYGSA